MATGLNRLGSSAYTSTPPAIVEQAKDWRYYEQAILNSEEHTGKLYREYKEGGAWKAHYKTWADACVPLGKSRSQVDRIIKADAVISAECAKVDHKQEQKALSQVEQAREIRETDHLPITQEGKTLAEMAAAFTEEPEKPVVHSADEVKRDEPKPKAQAKPQPVLDATGHTIPVNLLKTWERRQEVQDLMTLASKLKCEIKELYENKDPLFRGGALSFQSHISSLESIHYQLSQCKPGVVCPECNGAFKDDQGRECKKCRLTGFISESDWHQSYEKSNTSFIKAKVEARNGSARLSN